MTAIAALLFTFAAMLPHESSDQPIIDALRKRPIVEAVVLESHDPTGAIVVTTQRIDHAYCGGSELEGRTFYESSAGPRYAGDLRGAPPISPPLKVNESGIFLLRRLDDDRLIRYAPPARRGVEAGARRSSVLDSGLQYRAGTGVDTGATIAPDCDPRRRAGASGK